MQKYCIVVHINIYFKIRLLFQSERSCYTFFKILTFLVGVMKYIAFMWGTGSRFLYTFSTTIN